MRVVNSVLNGIFEILLVVPSALFGEAGLLLVSILFGVGMVVLFGRLSDPVSIRRSKDRIKAHLLSLSIYSHEIGLAGRTYARVFGSLGGYLGRLILPTLVLAIPFVVVAIQLEARYGRRPIRPGDAAVVSALFETTEDRALPDEVFLDAPAGVEVETPPIRIPVEGEVAWRIRAEKEGAYSLNVRIGGRQYEKTLVVGEGIHTLSARRPGSGIGDQILNPVEPPVDGSGGIRSIQVAYPKRGVSLLFWRTHWMVFFVLVSIAVALVAKVPLGVEI